MAATVEEEEEDNDSDADDEDGRGGGWKSDSVRDEENNLLLISLTPHVCLFFLLSSSLC